LNINDEELAVELAEVLPKERRKHMYLYEETLTVLDELKKTHKLLMLTNGARSLQYEKLKLSTELSPYFDYIVITGETVEHKPEPDILGAKRAEIDSIWINHHNEEIDEVTPTYEVKRLKDILSIINSRS